MATPTTCNLAAVWSVKCYLLVTCLPLRAEAVRKFDPMHVPIATKGYENLFVAVANRKRVDGSTLCSSAGYIRCVPKTEYLICILAKHSAENWHEIRRWDKPTMDSERKPSLCRTSAALWSMNWQHVSHRLCRPYMLAMSKMRHTLRMWSTALRYSDIADCSSTKPYWLASPRTSNTTSSCNNILGCVRYHNKGTI